MGLPRWPCKRLAAAIVATGGASSINVGLLLIAAAKLRGMQDSRASVDRAKEALRAR